MIIRSSGQHPKAVGLAQPLLIALLNAKAMPDIKLFKMEQNIEDFIRTIFLDAINVLLHFNGRV